MKLVHETEPGAFQLFNGGMLTRMENQAARKTTRHDGRVSAETINVDPYPIQVNVSLVVARAWSVAEQLAHGLHRVEAFAVPDGRRFVSGSQPTYSRPVKGGPVIETRETEPQPVVPVRTVEQKFNAMAQEFDLTPAELAGQVKKATPKEIAK